MSDPEVLGHDTIECAVCEEKVPRSHTVLRASLGRVCWFCHTDENVDPDAEWEDDEEDWEDWDD